MKRITVMAAGNGGQALAGDLALRGHEVVLYEHPAFSQVAETIRARGNTIELTNRITGAGRLASVTTDAAEALSDAELIYFTAPSYAQEAFFELALPHFRDGQTLVLSPGNYGVFGIKNALRRIGKDVLVGETDNLPYACTAKEPGLVDVRGVKNPVTLAAFPDSDYDRVDSAMQGAFCTSWKKGENVLQTSMANVNMIFHCVPMLMNAGRIESTRGDFRFYYDGMPPAVCRAMEAVDRERVAVARAFGLELPGARDTIRAQYGIDGSDLHSVIMANPAFGGSKPDAPKTLDHRFLTEDTPYSMVPLVELAWPAGVATPVMNAVVELCGLLNGTDYFTEGRTLAKMGLEGMTVDEIVALAGGGR